MGGCYTSVSSNVECGAVDCTDRWRAAVNTTSNWWAVFNAENVGQLSDCRLVKKDSDFCLKGASCYSDTRT